MPRGQLGSSVRVRCDQHPAKGVLHDGLIHPVKGQKIQWLNHQACTPITGPRLRLIG